MTSPSQLRWLLPVLFPIACAGPPERPDAVPDESDVHLAYTEAVEAARYPRPAGVRDDLVRLSPDNPDLTWDSAGRVLVTTWSRSRYYASPEYVPGYTFALYGETWFTAGSEVQDICRQSGLTGDALALRLEQLLGLPPGGGRDVFLQIFVRPDDLFRPCSEPSVTASSCPLAAPLALTEEGASYWDCPGDTDHSRWLCDNWIARYGSSDPQRNYPWSALGYTWDWASPADPSGPTEFVARGGTEAVLHAITPVGEFCAP